MDSSIKMIGAITPGICLLTYFYLKDKDQPEPIRLVFKMFIAGGLVVFPLIILQSIFNHFISGVFLQSFFVSAFSEELIKWSLMYYLIFNHMEFDEHFDSIVYSVATAAGFATIENIFYVFLEQGPVLFHGLFNSILYGSDWLATVFILLFMVFLWIFNINRMNSALKEK